MNVLKPLELPEDPDDIDSVQEQEDDDGDAQSNGKEEAKSEEVPELVPGDAGEQ